MKPAAEVGSPCFVGIDSKVRNLVPEAQKHWRPSWNPTEVTTRSSITNSWETREVSEPSGWAGWPGALAQTLQTSNLGCQIVPLMTPHKDPRWESTPASLLTFCHVLTGTKWMGFVFFLLHSLCSLVLRWKSQSWNGAGERAELWGVKISNKHPQFHGRNGAKSPQGSPLSL